MEDDFRRQREAMVRGQLAERGITDRRVLDAMRRVPRHAFVPHRFHDHAYADRPLPIHENQTISQPFIVAMMSQLLRLDGHERGLEIGTGSGYQTAILCELAAEVFSIEYYPRLADSAAATLARLGYTNVEIHTGDGSQGLPDMAPFDAILVTAAAPAVPGPLRAQLCPDGGRLVLPVGDDANQYLEVVTRQGDDFQIERLSPVRFVPLRGRFGFADDNG
jgi:protein-L-isoaspartate(D-aspartate) O-methyltransferase